MLGFIALLREFVRFKMFEFKKVSKVELEKIVRNAALKLGVNEVVIEKDYWVCFI